jgi:hypothetical protein
MFCSPVSLTMLWTARSLLPQFCRLCLTCPSRCVAFSAGQSRAASDLGCRYTRASPVAPATRSSLTSKTSSISSTARLAWRLTLCGPRTSTYCLPDSYGVELTLGISDVSEVIAKIQTVFAWTATGSTIPYSHFSDWLKFAPEPSLPGSTSLSTQFPVSTAVGNATATAFPVSTAVVNATATAFPVSTAVLNATATAFPVTTAIVTATAVTSVATTSA